MTALAEALDNFHAGRVREAETLCRELVERDPVNARALHLLGVLAHQSGRNDAAVELISRAVALEAGNAEFHYNLGVALQTLGRSEEAVASYRQALGLQPHRAEAHNNLGHALLQQGRLGDALPCFEQAVRLRPDYAEAHHNRGEALRQLGKPSEAEASLREAVRLRPDHVAAGIDLGRVLADQGKDDEAEASFRLALRLRPDHAGAHNHLGLLLLRHGQLEQARDCFEQALRGDPADADAHNNLGVVLREQGRPDEAVACFHRALALQPDHAGAHNNLGRVCEDRGRLEEAAARYRLALCYQPGDASVQNNLGNALTRMSRPDEALPCYQQAVRLQSQEPVFHSNLANALTLAGRPEEAEVCCRQALRLRPGFANARHNLAITLAAQGKFAEALAHNEEALRIEPDHSGARNCRALWWLQQGDFAHGWPEYEWRWQVGGVTRRTFREPAWDGSPLDGRTVLLYAEQALGDTLQFIRYVPLVKRRGGTVVVECQPPLARLLANCPGIDRLVPRGSPLPPFDVQAALLSLPRLLGTTMETVPADVPYLFADPGLVASWRQELDPSACNVGIAWQGSATFAGDRLRSAPLRHFAPLARVEGVRLFGLQKGPARDQIRAVARQFAVTDLGSSLDEAGGAFLDTAAVMTALDLVITTDTAVAHLAGALGVPVWVALSVGPDWRWLLGREDSPWYPTMRLFRQSRPHDWDEVFERVADELRRRQPACHAFAAHPGPASQSRTPKGRESMPPDAPSGPPRATVCVLTFGDHLPYFRRCLDSVLRHTPPGRFELRLGFNAAPAALAYARQCLPAEGEGTDSQVLPGGVRRTSFVSRGLTVRLCESPVNLYKEPMARLLYHDLPLATEYAVWFDDDSFVEEGWWQALCPLFDRHVDYIGQTWWVDYLPGQEEMVRSQPWYRGVPFDRRDGRPGAWFMTGGFMAVRAQGLRQANFPDTERTWKGDALRQYGGDTLLGEVARQLGWTRVAHDAHVRVNVDLEGRHPAPRRGGTGRQFGADLDVAIR
jgi:tetratricopeptide (TPR) repeat protein